MAEEPGRDRGFITPPPGLLPAARPRDELEGTDSGTRKISRDGPVFFPRPPGAAPPAEPAASAPEEPTPRVEPAWTLRTAEGVEHPIPAAGLVIGRNPARPDGWEHAALLGVDDPEKTVSKTHAALRIDGDRLLVIDLASTNGTTVAAPDGAETPVGVDAGTPVPAGSTIGLGSYPVRATRT